jgi:hypothetical protein
MAVESPDHAQTDSLTRPRKNLVDRLFSFQNQMLYERDLSGRRTPSQYLPRVREAQGETRPGYPGRPGTQVAVIDSAEVSSSSKV